MAQTTTPDPSAATFCGAETQISDHTCNSLHPAVSIDPYGTAGVVWHDTRNGVFDIYFKTTQHPLPSESLSLGLDGTVDPNTGRAINVACSGYSAYKNLSDSCLATSATPDANFIARHSGGILDVNVTARSIVLSGTRGEDFVSEGIKTGSTIKIETGLNSASIFIVSSILTNAVLGLVYYDGPVSDTGFVYTVESNPTTNDVCETRLTCSTHTSTFPDIQADHSGRFHVVYEEGDNGNDDIYYVQIFPSNVGELKCATNRPLTVGLGQDVPASTGSGGVAGTGATSSVKSFVYGNVSIPDPVGNRSGTLMSRTGLHRLFADFETDNKWTGVSDVEDMPLWRQQIDAIGSPIGTPPYIAPANHPLIEQGDFGSKFSFKQLAFIAESSGDGKTTVTKVSLPLKPKCTPSSIPFVSGMREQDLVAAPKVPVPFEFDEVIDLSTLSDTTVDSMPPRFMIEGDPTVYTNSLIQGPNGLSRLIFQKDPSSQKEIKFILGQRLCGTENCAVTVPSDLSNSQASNQSQYKVRLEVWQGPLVSDIDISTASMTATKVFADDFLFSPGDDRRTFLIDSGRAIVDAGHYIFFVAIPDAGNPYFIDAVGSGNVVWSTDNDDPSAKSLEFDQYYSPYTVPPSAGLFANVYFEGTVDTGVSVAPPIPSTKTLLGSSAPAPYQNVGPITVIDSDSVRTSNPRYFIGQDFKLPVDAEIISVEMSIKPIGFQFIPETSDGETNDPVVLDSTSYSMYIVSASDLASPYQFSTVSRVVGGDNPVKFSFANKQVLPAGTYSILFSVGKDGPEVAAMSTLPYTGNPPTFGLTYSAATATDFPAYTYSFPNKNTQNDLGQIPFIMSYVPQTLVSQPVFIGDIFDLPESDQPIADTPSKTPSIDYVMGPTLKLTTDGGEHPRLARDNSDNLWLVFHSSRTGNNEVYITKFFGDCGQWASSTQGGNEFQLTSASNGGASSFANCVCDRGGEVHIVWQSTDTEDNHSEIFYTRSTGGGSSFRKPIRLTSSPADALMPDIAISRLPSGEEKVVVVWHDSRYTSFEIMSAVFDEGVWYCSGQGKTDTRVSSAPGDSMFVRAFGDTKGNVRIVWHDYRKGLGNPGIYLGTYVGTTGEWQCSGQGNVDTLITPTGQRSSLFPDLSLDPTNGVEIVWQDDRLALTSPDQHEEIFGAYCSRQDAVLVHYSALTSANVEGIVMSTVKVVNCVTGDEVSFTNSQNVCLNISAPGATYYRIANENGNFGDWQQFTPMNSLDTTVSPWRLSAGNGTKTILVQVQTDQAIGFPVQKTVILQAAPPSFSINLYSDQALSVPLPSKNGIPVISYGQVYMLLTTDVPLLDLPTYDVISLGRSISNQQMQQYVPASSGASGTSGFSGVSGASQFQSTFRISKDDGLFHIDGPARIIPHGTDIYGNTF